MGGRGLTGVKRGEAEFTSTEPPRHSAPDCDIYPPSLQPTLCFCHRRISILPSRLPSYTPGGRTPHIDPLPSASFTTAIPLRGLSLRCFPIYEASTPLLAALRHHCAFATIPQCSLGLRVGVGFANARIRLVSDSRHYFHEEVCISYYCKRSASLRRFFSRAREKAFRGSAFGCAIRNPPTIRGA